MNILSPDQNGIEQTYTITSSLAFTGTTPPSGTLTATYRWSRIGNVTFARFFFVWVTVGSGIQNVIFDLPADMPVPEKPSGFTANNVIIGTASGGIGTSIPNDYQPSRAGLHSATTSSTGYLVSISSGALAIKAIEVTLIYFTNS